MAGDIAVKVLQAVTGADNARTEAAQDQRGFEEVFEDGQHAGVIDGLVEDAVHYGQVGDVAGGAAMGVVGAHLPFTPDQRLPESVHLVPREHAVDELSKNHSFGISLIHPYSPF